MPLLWVLSCFLILSANAAASSICTNCPELKKIKHRAQYDANTYYHNSYRSALNESALRKAIHKDIATDFHQLSYNEIWTALTYTDEDMQNSDNIKLIYKGNSIAKANNGSAQFSTYQDYWNREHIWPKSHGFAKRSQQGYSDLHHLKPADVSMNTKRSDNDFAEGGEPIAEAPSNKKHRSLSFEPNDHVKGDIARILFYMDVMYEEGSHSDMPNLELVNFIDTERTSLQDGVGQLGELCTLYAWHINDPVDAFEINRNHTIYEFQGNRNPFIDHPEWVKTLYHNKCNSTISVYIEQTRPVQSQTKVKLTARANAHDIKITWQQIKGPKVESTLWQGSQFIFIAPQVKMPSNLVFLATVEDNNGNITSAEASVDVYPDTRNDDTKPTSVASTHFISLLLLTLLCVRRRLWN